MSFIEKNLSTNERIQYSGKMHWYIYLRGVFLIILGLFSTSVSDPMSAFLIFIGLVSLIFAFMNARSSEFAVTNKRIILKTGVLKRTFIELQLNRSEGLNIDQGMMGRLFNFGTIKITTGGVGEKFSFLAAPFDFKKQVNNAVEASFVGTSNPLTM